MDKALRNLLYTATVKCRKLLEEDFALQLEGVYGVHTEGKIEPIERLVHLDAVGRADREAIEATLLHYQKTGGARAQAVERFVRESAFTLLNRLAALKLMEHPSRALVQPSLLGGAQSKGFKQFSLISPEALRPQPDGGYQIYLELLFDDLSEALGVLFDRGLPTSLLFPTQPCLQELLGLLNAPDLEPAWGEDETIGWVYQYFTPGELRDAARKASGAPRSSYELAFRNQFYTPRYVVAFLADNTLGRLWRQMMGGKTRLKDLRFAIDDLRLTTGAESTIVSRKSEVINHPKRDPRTLRVLDPAVGSAHFLLYCFDLFQVIYEEAWLDPQLGPVLWRDLGWTPDIDATIANLVAPESVRLRGDAVAECFACDRRLAVTEAFFALGDYNAPWLCGRPFIYCPACAEKRAEVITLSLPLDQFDFGQALAQGWFAHGTGTIFVEIARVFTYRRTEMPEQGLFEALSQAAAPEALAILHTALPNLILTHNLHGIDIDLRACQIASLALWLRAHRAYKEMGLRMRQRPRLDTIHIVCAEPMPGEYDLLGEFARDLKPLVLEKMLREVWEQMKLAGEAGSLLKVEQEIRQAVHNARVALQNLPPGIQLSLFAPEQAQPLRLRTDELDDADFWNEAVERVIEALRDYARLAAGGHEALRRIFVAEALQGMAFIDLLQQPFDIVLMNPPFGAASLGSKDYIARLYPRTKNDLYAAFVERGLELLRPGGYLGAITSRTGFFLTSFQKWREEILLQEAYLVALADLGYGVLDTAMVETAAYVVHKHMITLQE